MFHFRVVVSSRSGAKDTYQKRWLSVWRKRGMRVVISNEPISDLAGCQRLIEQCLEYGQLEGVFHLAMVLRDSLFEDQNADNFKQAALAKYWGTKNLDAVTRKLCGNTLKW